MKKLKTRNEYVGCNGKCRFYADEIRATSYGWWNFVKVINSKVIFNDHNYSSTTVRHQWEVKSLLKSLNIKIDAYVYLSESLNENNFNKDALYHFYDLAIQKIVQNNTKRVRKKTIENNKLDIDSLKDDIKKLRSMGAEFSFTRIIRLYRQYKKQRDNKEVFLKETKGLINQIVRDKNNKRFKVVKINSKNETIELLTQDEQWNYSRNITYYWFKDLYTECKLSTILIG